MLQLFVRQMLGEEQQLLHEGIADDCKIGEYIFCFCCDFMNINLL